MEVYLKLLKEDPIRPAMQRIFKLGEVARYGRKSTKGSDGGNKSLEDQDTDTLETCERFELPTNENDWYREPAGHSGKLAYDGGGKFAVPEAKKIDDKGRRRTRPELTRLVRDVMEGRKKVIVVWKLDRLFRSVLLCEHLIDLFEAYGIELYDCKGKVDYTSVDGRSNIRALANHYETKRENDKENVTSGLRKNRKKGKIASNPNCLGMRTAGTRTNRVKFIDEELFWVLRMMNLFVGDGERAPLGPSEIGQAVEAEGFRWPEDLRRNREAWEPRFPGQTYNWMVMKVLTNPRYVGYHPTKEGSYQCDAFLRDGKTLVPIELFNRVQMRLESLKRIGNAGMTGRAFASILLCGYDAQSLQCQQMWAERKNGVREKYPVWRMAPRPAGWCSHLLPNIREQVLLDYVFTTMAPLLAAHARVAAARGQETDEARLGQLRTRLSELVHEHEVTAVELLKTTWRSDPELALRLRESLSSQISQVRSEIARLEGTRCEALTLAPYIEQLQSLDEGARREAIRALIRWAAVVPSNMPPTYYESLGEWARNVDQGRILFLTAFGVYHTAVIEFGQHPNGYRKRINTLRAAAPYECLGGVVDLPHPDLFVSNLRSSWTRRGILFDVDVEAPGYSEWLQRKSQEVYGERLAM